MHGAALLLELGAIILGLGLLGSVAARVGVSPIPLYLLAGLAFGRGGLATFATSGEFITAGAEIGLILLLFTLGLEYTARELVVTLRRSAPLGLLDLAANATPGVVAGLLLGWGTAGSAVLGGVTYVTSSGITAKVLSDLEWLGNRETPVVLSLLVLEDLAMALYLPMLTALLAGASLLSGSLTLTFAALTVAGVFVVALRFGAAVERFLRSPTDEVLLLKVLGTTLLVGGVAQRLQVSAAVGAFLVGIALSGPVAHVAAERLTPLRDLFGAVFFVSFGLQTNPRDLPGVAAVAAALAAVGVGTKYATGRIAARRAGVGRAASRRAGIAIVPRGEFSIVIAGLAVSGGAPPALGPLAAGYTLLLAVTGPIMARALQHSSDRPDH